VANTPLPWIAECRTAIGGLLTVAEASAVSEDFISYLDKRID
jgi:hypothetical protein